MTRNEIYNTHPYDLVVIGGGINGVGIAADAAGRGLSVLLCEKDDLASGTSSASSKLIHGGLRYLENYEFSLVRSSLKERKILLKNAPHLVKPLPFIMPFQSQLRPFWLIRTGLFIYDLMGHGKDFKRSTVFSSKMIAPNLLKNDIPKGFIYSDCIADDARLVIMNALQASLMGAQIRTRVKCNAANRQKEYWEIELQEEKSSKTYQVRAQALVNASGPWVSKLIPKISLVQSQYDLRLVKGSHIVVPKIYDANQAYVLQHKDGRIIFVIPYLNQFSLIGTTDVDFNGDPSSAKIDANETAYLCDVVNQYFDFTLKPQQILYSWSGVRGLVKENNVAMSQNTREYKLEILTVDDRLPLLNVFGGKLTTYRLLAEQAVNLLSRYFPHCSKPWTEKVFLPGGDLPQNSMNQFLSNLAKDFDWLPEKLAMRYANHYGTLTYKLLKNTNQLQDLGKDFGQGLYEAEVEYLKEHEWAKTMEDILWRRTKMGLFLSLSEQQLLAKSLS